MENKMNVLTSIQTNYLSWIAIIISIVIVSYPVIVAGFITFFVLLISAYFMHRSSHDYRNILTILHHYHHENDNFFSHFSQILLELSYIIVIIPLYNYLGDSYIDIWSAILFILFYSTVHNYNYGQLKVNKVHYLHHINMYTNIGPDVCDVAFGTKHPDNTEVENTNHYIPNVIIIGACLAFIKYYLFTFDKVKDTVIFIFTALLKLTVLFVAFSSVCLYFTYNPQDNKSQNNVLQRNVITEESVK